MKLCTNTCKLAYLLSQMYAHQMLCKGTKHAPQPPRRRRAATPPTAPPPAAAAADRSESSSRRAYAHRIHASTEPASKRQGIRSQPQAGAACQEPGGRCLWVVVQQAAGVAREGAAHGKHGKFSTVQPQKHT